MQTRWLTKRKLQAMLDNYEDVRIAQNAQEVAAGRAEGFKEARKMFERERKQLLQFASLAALGNAKSNTKLLELAAKNFNASLEVDNV